MEQKNISGIDFEQLASGLLEEGNMLRFRAHGNSMLPFVKDNDIIVVAPIENNNIKKGDIVFYQGKKESPVAHRVISLTADNEFIFVRGDGYIGGAEKIPIKKVTGIVCEIERNNKTINRKKTSYKLMVWCWTKIQAMRWLLFRINRKLKSVIVDRSSHNIPIIIGTALLLQCFHYFGNFSGSIIWSR